MIHGDAWVLWSSGLWVCLFYALNVTGPASKSQIPQRGEEVFHFLLKERLRFSASSRTVQSFSVWSKHSFLFLPAPSLAQSLHLRTHRWNSTLLQPAEGRTQMCDVDNTDIHNTQLLMKEILDGILSRAFQSFSSFIKITCFRKARQRGVTIMYGMWKIMCFFKP